MKAMAGMVAIFVVTIFFGVSVFAFYDNDRAVLIPLGNLKTHTFNETLARQLGLTSAGVASGTPPENWERNIASLAQQNGDQGDTTEDPFSGKFAKYFYC